MSISLNQNMASIVKSLEKNMESNNLEKLVETMTTFEKQFENLDLQTSVMDDVMSKQVSVACGNIMQQERGCSLHMPIMALEALANERWKSNLLAALQGHSGEF